LVGFCESTSRVSEDFGFDDKEILDGSGVRGEGHFLIIQNVKIQDE
jgi:hypothetical protein